MIVKFNIRSTEIKIEFSFLLVLAVSFLLNNIDVVYVILFSALHEAGQLLALLAFRQKAHQIIVSYYGIGLKYRAHLSFCKELVLYISGVGVNLIFFLIGIRRDINGALFIINILPVFPLDGGRVVKLILNSVFSLEISDKIYFFVSLVFISVLILFSVVTKNISLVVISIYALLFAINNSFD